MRNIHILPTDKPILDGSINYILKCIKSFKLNRQYNIGDTLNELSWDFDSNYWKPQHIYITSNEELILGGYHFNSKYGNEPEKTVQRDINSRESWEEEDYYISKIILTTDPDLIKQGVQAIPNNFLEWFVKNPNCEFIEWDKNYNRGNGKYYYKIIIPKEEPRQDLGYTTKLGIEVSDKMIRAVMIPNEYFGKEELKQETLEEVAEKLKGKELFKKSNDRARKLLSEIELLPIAETLEEYIERETKSIIEPSLRAAAIAFLRYGAKWQQEQDKNKFSIEEVVSIVKKSLMYCRSVSNIGIDKWVEQFKKK